MRSFIVFFLCMFFVMWGTPEVSAAEQSISNLQTNQQMLENIYKSNSRPEQGDNKWTANGLDITDTTAVLLFVLKNLPDSVKIYPTENYYYFSFFHAGVEFAGNLRLDAYDRNAGILHFAYFNKITAWNREVISQYKKFSSLDGVVMTKLSGLKYKVEHGGVSVVFNLNDLSKVNPAKGLLHEWEEYIGPVYDESGFQFFLVYNQKSKLFLFIVNDDVPMPDKLFEIQSGIAIGLRSGFAFYTDQFLKRRILIGVYETNSLLNNYFDGPFDQLPDNFLKGDQLKLALIDERPLLAGKIDRFGSMDKGESRVLVSPYMHYRNVDELAAISVCAQKSDKNLTAFYRCFKVENAAPVKTAQ